MYMVSVAGCFVLFEFKTNNCYMLIYRRNLGLTFLVFKDVQDMIQLMCVCIGFLGQYFTVYVEFCYSIQAQALRPTNTLS